MTRRIEWLHDGRIAQGSLLQVYSEDERRVLYSLDYVNVHMRHFFLPEAQANLAALRAAGVKLMLYVNMLQAPRVMDTVEGSWDHLWATLHAPAITNFKAWKGRVFDLYWCDPTRIEPEAVANFIVGHIDDAQVTPDAIYCDHAIERPWLYDERRSLTDDEWPNEQFQTWQKDFTETFLTQEVPPNDDWMLVFVNGRWPIDAHSFWKGHVDGKQWERLGSRWSKWLPLSLAKIGQWNDSSVQQILDVRGHPAYTVDGAIARLMAATRPHLLLRTGSLT